MDQSGPSMILARVQGVLDQRERPARMGLAGMCERASESTAVEWLGQTLRHGAVHEWLAGGDASRFEPRSWLPPIGIVIDAASRLAAQPRDNTSKPVLWIGRACWPYPLVLAASPGLLRGSIFIDPPDAASRLWAMDVALRGESPCVVVGDGSGLKLAQTRRLQLAAGHRQGACLLVRPARDGREFSAATTRWRVEPAIARLSPTARARWTVTLLRHKDHPVLMDEPPAWCVEWDDAQSRLSVVAPVAGGTGAAAIGKGGERSAGPPQRAASA